MQKSTFYPKNSTFRKFNCPVCGRKSDETYFRSFVKSVLLLYVPHSRGPNRKGKTLAKPKLNELWFCTWFCIIKNPSGVLTKTCFWNACEKRWRRYLFAFLWKGKLIVLLDSLRRAMLLYTPFSQHQDDTLSILNILAGCYRGMRSFDLLTAAAE